jgi:hypothetical protein
MTSRPREPMVAVPEGSLVVSVVRFCRLLRSWGVPVAAGASQTAVEALREIDLARREDFRTALALTLVRRPEDYPLFTYLFNAYWGSGATRNTIMPGEEMAERPADVAGPSPRAGGDETDGGSETGGLRLEAAVGIAEAEIEGLQASRAAVTGATGERTARPADRHEQAELQRAAAALAKLLATRPSRRRVRDRGGRIVDPRGMLRESLRYGGLPIELRWKSRRVARTRLLLFCDVSRSMDEYAQFFLRFSAAVLRRLWRVEAFLFANDIVRVGDRWAERAWHDLSLSVPACGGGTQIGKCLQRFLDAYDVSLLGSGTIVLILSDGLDTGDPTLIATAMERLRRRAHAVIWLNPLLHLEGYEPRAAGMAAALKYVDVFAPVHDMRSMWELVAVIRALATRPRSGFRPRGLGDREPRARDPETSVTDAGSGADRGLRVPHGKEGAA